METLSRWSSCQDPWNGSFFSLMRLTSSSKIMCLRPYLRVTECSQKVNRFVSPTKGFTVFHFSTLKVKVLKMVGLSELTFSMHFREISITVTVNILQCQLRERFLTRSFSLDVESGDSSELLRYHVSRHHS